VPTLQVVVQDCHSEQELEIEKVLTEEENSHSELEVE